jgi:hypothetical protein
MVDEGLITQDEALARVTEEQLEAASARAFAGEPPAELVIADEALARFLSWCG